MTPKKRSFGNLSQYAIWFVFIAMAIIFTVGNPVFIKPNNIIAILRQIAVYGVARRHDLCYPHWRY